MESTCKICGDKTPKGRRTFCSDECYKQDILRRNRENNGNGELTNITNCLVCGDSLEGQPNANMRKYCTSCDVLDGNSVDKHDGKRYEDYLRESKRRNEKNKFNQ